MADLPYRIVIGLEVHVQLLTQTKLFCGCSTRFGLPPNSATCPVCIGLPGVLPVMNRRAFDLALAPPWPSTVRSPPSPNGTARTITIPICRRTIRSASTICRSARMAGWRSRQPTGRKRIGIIRAHLEEDAGKMLHDEHGTGKEVWSISTAPARRFWRSSASPSLSSPEEAKAYLEEIRLLLREIGVSDCEMQEGSLRCDANVNFHIPADRMARRSSTPIVEVKNLNSFRAVERAMKYEAQRQYEEGCSDRNYRSGKWRRRRRAGTRIAAGRSCSAARKKRRIIAISRSRTLVPVVVDAAWRKRADRDGRVAVGAARAAERAIRLIAI